MKQVIEAVAPGSAADKAGLRAGDGILLINGEPVKDQIDYQALTAGDGVSLLIERASGEREQLIINKRGECGLGLAFGESMALSPARCRNKCAFCFIDQNPKGLRETLYVKDDDWRFSLMMGNFVTLTNVDGVEFDRMLLRRPSPLYISVHATDPDTRCRLMSNRHAGDIMEKLTSLAGAGIRFHCQIVLCPGINDGETLTRTLCDLRSLWPAALSVALVPVGLTRHRQGLKDLAPYGARDAAELMDFIAPFQAECLKTMGTVFVFPSDEFYCLSGRETPPLEWYEDFPQIENGVGLMRKLESEMEEADAASGGGKPAGRLIIATGVSAAPHIRRLCARFAPPGSDIRVEAVKNRFFGESVTVAGLLTGGDILMHMTPERLSGADALLITRSMLRSEGDRFLDDMTLAEFSRRLPVEVRVIENDGQELYEALRENKKVAAPL